jgi:hypothetical protein
MGMWHVFVVQGACAVLLGGLPYLLASQGVVRHLPVSSVLSCSDPWFVCVSCCVGYDAVPLQSAMRSCCV